MRKITVDTGLRIVGIYLILAVTWLLFSDNLLSLISPSATDSANFHTYLDWGFSLFSAALLYLLIEHYRKQEHTLRNAIHERDTWLHLAHSIVGVGAWEWDLATQHTRWSPETEKLYGLEPGQFRGTYEAWLDLIHPQDRPAVIDAVQTGFANHQPFIIEYRVQHPSGAEHWLLCYGNAVFNTHGDPDRLLGVNMDITARKKAELSLRENESILIEAQRLAQLGNWRWDFQHDQAQWSAEVYRILGRDPTLPAAGFQEIRHYFEAASWDRIAEAVEECLQEGTPFDVDTQVIHADQQPKWVRVHGKPIYDSTNVITEVRGFMQDITERKLLEQTLRDNEERHRTVLEYAADAVFITNPQGRYIYTNQQATELLGYSNQELEKMTIRDIVPDSEIQFAMESFRKLGEQGHFLSEINLEHRDGHIVPVELNAVRLPRGDFFAACRDITERLRSESYQRQAAAVYESSRDGIIITDTHARIVAVNPAFTTITGYSGDEVIGQTPRLLKSDRHPRNFYQQMWSAIKTGDGWSGEIWNRRKDGGVYPEWLSISTVTDNAGNVLNYVGVFSDLTQLKRTEAELEHLTTHDPLTDLPNVRLLEARIEHAILRAKRHRYGLAVLMLDIDRFKDINDSLGMYVGDTLLKEMAERVVKTLWQSDTVARLGGDELVVLIEELKDTQHALLVADKIRAALRPPYTINGQQYFLTVSIGISLYPENGDTPELLIREADAAVYRAKEEGRNRTTFYTESLSRSALERLSLEAGLRYALEHNELELHYQPQLLLHTRELAGLEALVRWRHPSKGLIPPDQFIPLAERTGLIETIGEWVLEEACRQMAAWRKAGIAIPRIAVNLSANQLGRKDLVEAVNTILIKYDLPTSVLELEITETAIMQDPQKATDTLKAMADLGIAMAVDDFGTGYSSLAYLQRLQLHRLKIDRAFVQGLPDNKNNVAICRAIIAMADSLGMETIAEGIEESVQHEFLDNAACTIGQGWLYAKAMPADELEKWLSHHSTP